VYLTTARSSKADDSLFAVGEILVEMAQRFGPVPYREKAVDAYQFLIKEYPYSPLSQQARKKLEELGSPAPAQAGEAETAATESRPGGRLRPGGAAPPNAEQAGEPAGKPVVATRPAGTEVETAAAESRPGGRLRPGGAAPPNAEQAAAPAGKPVVATRPAGTEVETAAAESRPG